MKLYNVALVIFVAVFLFTFGVAFTWENPSLLRNIVNWSSVPFAGWIVYMIIMQRPASDTLRRRVEYIKACFRKDR